MTRINILSHYGYIYFLAANYWIKFQENYIAKLELIIKLISMEDWYVGNIGFLASYNSRWFDRGYAPSGYEKTKNGLRFRDYYKEASNNILKQLPNMKGVQLEVSDYRSLNIHNSVVYCDPPYQGVKQYANSLDFDYDEFWETMRKWSRDNIVLISELNAPDDFSCIWSQEVSRSIKSTDKSRATEKLFIYNP